MKLNVLIFSVHLSIFKTSFSRLIFHIYFRCIDSCGEILLQAHESSTRFLFVCCNFPKKFTFQCSKQNYSLVRKRLLNEIRISGEPT